MAKHCGGSLRQVLYGSARSPHLEQKAILPGGTWKGASALAKLVAGSSGGGHWSAGAASWGGTWGWWVSGSGSLGWLGGSVGCGLSPVRLSSPRWGSSPCLLVWTGRCPCAAGRVGRAWGWGCRGPSTSSSRCRALVASVTVGSTVSLDWSSGWVLWGSCLSMMSMSACVRERADVSWCC